MSVNKVILVGRVGKDPEFRQFETGSVANFSLATSEKYKNKVGEAVENTEWHNLSAFGKLSEIVRDYVKKGSLLYVEGKIKTRSYERDGEKKYVTEVLIDQMRMLGDNPQGQQPQGRQQGQGSQPEQQQQQFTPPDSGSDDLPF